MIHQSSGQGALFELVARGVKDTYFVKDSKDSYFPYNTQYDSSIPHLAERKLNIPINGATFGNTFEVEIETYGDIMTECAFEIDLPTWLPPLPISMDMILYDPSIANGLYPITSTSNYSYGYVNYIGYFLFEKIQFYQDQFLIQEWSGDGLLAKQLTEGSYNSSFLQQTIGGLNETVDLFTNQPTDRGIQLRATPGHLRLKLPLPGLQCPGDGGFPLTAIPWQKFRIKATLRKLEDLIVCSCDSSLKPEPWNVLFKMNLDIVSPPISFSTPGTYTWIVPRGVTTISILIVAGGGGGGGGVGCGGGGGAGGVIYTSYTVIPGTTYNIVIGNGGAGGIIGLGENGGNSIFDTFVAMGGGAGGSNSINGNPGGSGGGGGQNTRSIDSGGNGDDPASGTLLQGHSGAVGYYSIMYSGGGGGGAYNAGTSGTGDEIDGIGGEGGIGANINGIYYGAGGGGGVLYGGTSAPSASNVGGIGGNDTSNNGTNAIGYGNGGGGGSNGNGGAGSGGIIIINYNKNDASLYTFSPKPLSDIGQPTIQLSTIQHYVPLKVQQELRSNPIQIPFRRQFENNFTFGELDYVSLDNGGTSTVTRRLDGRHPTERIFWFFRTQHSINRNQLDNFYNNYFDFNSNMQAFTQPYGNFYYNMKIVIAGRDRESMHQPFVWQDISQLVKDEKGCGVNIGEMKWTTGEKYGTIYPTPRQPEGTINFTTADRPTLYIELANIRPDVLGQRTSEFRVFTEGWSVYDIREGRCRLLFAN